MYSQGSSSYKYGQQYSGQASGSATRSSIPKPTANYQSFNSSKQTGTGLVRRSTYDGPGTTSLS